MVPLFLALTAVNLLALCGTAALGYGVSNGHAWSSYHQLAGVLSTIVCCAVHCVVFTYFMATSKWVQHAVTVKRLDDTLVTPTRSFKALAFPAAIAAMFAVFLAAVVGAATFSYQLRPIYHHVSALLAIVVNAIVAMVELRAIRQNGALIDRILGMIKPTNQAPVAERQTQRT
jgi:Ni/Fe-hydrogenase subunit HybB-like protein